MPTSSSAAKQKTRVTLREVTRENLNDILDMGVNPEQGLLIASNAKSIAQAHFSPSAWYRAIYTNDTPVGFAMIRDLYLLEYEERQKLEEDGWPAYYLWRFMIDGRFQRKGYGALGMELVINHVKSRPNARQLTLHHQNRAGNAGDFYKKFGFKHTGEEHEGELEMRLIL